MPSAKMWTSRTKLAGLFAVLGLALVVLGWSIRTRSSRALAQGAEASASAAPAPAGARSRAARRRPPARASIEGSVTDTAGAPIAGATVCGSAHAGVPPMVETREPICTQTDALGRYRLADLFAAHWVVDASAPGYQPAEFTTKVPGHPHCIEIGAGEARTGVDLALPFGGVEVRGHVKDVNGGSIAGALVIISSQGADGADVVTRSDAQGAFSGWVAEGRFYARAMASGYASNTKSGGAPGPEVEILLTPEAVLVGRVVEADTHAPVAGAAIEIESDDMFLFVDIGHVAPPDRAAAYSGEDGRFRVEKLEPGRYKPFARAPGWFGQARESVLLGVGQTSSEVLIEVHPARAVEGRVVIAPSQEPCTRGNVSLTERMRKRQAGARLGADGAARFEGLLPGSYEVHVECEDHAAEPSYPPVVVADADMEGLTWTVRDGLMIRGRVVDRAGKPATGSVRARLIESDFRSFDGSAYEKTEADGSFTLRGLRPGKYRVVAYAQERADAEPIEVELREGPVPELTLVIDDGGSLEGTLADEDGRPLAETDIMTFGPQYEQATTRPDGVFRFKGLKPGDYRLEAREDGVELRTPGQREEDAPIGRVTVKAGATAHVRLTVERRSGVIHGRVVDEIGEPVNDAFIEARREPEGAREDEDGPRRGARATGYTPMLTDVDGSFTVTRLPRGTYTVRAYREGGGEALAEHVALGATVTLTLKRTGSIAGTVSAPGGEPVEQFTVRVFNEEADLSRSEGFLFNGSAWTMSDLPEGTYEVVAKAKEGEATAKVQLARGEQKSGVALTLTARAAVKGQVVSVDGGAPVPGMRVYIEPRRRGGDSHAGSEGGPVTTDSDGRFTIEDAPSGSITLMIMPAGASEEYGFARIPADAPPGTSTDLGRLEIAKRRVKREEGFGDLGFTVKASSSDEGEDGAPLSVSEVRAGGPAAAAGLRVGDVIVAVDGHDISGKRSYLYWMLVRIPEGTALSLGLARGGTVAITAAGRED
jgi:protocatechuate 3,4-dioxygenase beta subunit